MMYLVKPNHRRKSGSLAKALLVLGVVPLLLSSAVAQVSSESHNSTLQKRAQIIWDNVLHPQFDHIHTGGFKGATGLAVLMKISPHCRQDL